MSGYTEGGYVQGPEGSGDSIPVIVQPCPIEHIVTYDGLCFRCGERLFDPAEVLASLQRRMQEWHESRQAKGRGDAPDDS